jgi:hypothetical protein
LLVAVGHGDGEAPGGKSRSDRTGGSGE